MKQSDGAMHFQGSITARNVKKKPSPFITKIGNQLGIPTGDDLVSGPDDPPKSTADQVSYPSGIQKP